MHLRVAAVRRATQLPAVRGPLLHVHRLLSLHARPCITAAMATAAATPRRVLVPIGTGSEDIETSAIVDTLRRAGYTGVCSGV